MCAIGGQHDGHLPFWLPSFVKLIMLLEHVCLLAEINMLLLLLVSLAESILRRDIEDSLPENIPTNNIRLLKIENRN